MEANSIGDLVMGYTFVVKERRSQKGHGRSPLRNLWSSHEWEDVGKKDLEDRVLLEYDRNRLH